MQIRKLLPAVCLLTTIVSIAYGGQLLHNPYGKPCLPGGGAETQGMDGGKDVSDPINLATGDFQHVQTDLVIPGRGLDFEIRRFYRSLSGIQAAEAFLENRGSTYPHWDLLDVDTETPFGHHWDFNYGMRLSLTRPDIELLDNSNPQEGIDPIEPFVIREFLPDRVSLMTGTGR